MNYVQISGCKLCPNHSISMPFYFKVSKTWAKWLLKMTNGLIFETKLLRVVSYYF